MQQKELPRIGPRARLGGAALAVLVALSVLPATAAGPKTRLASQGNTGEPAANGSDASAISGNGAVAAFISNSDNLPQGDGTTVQVYVRDFDAEKTRPASRASNGEVADEDSREPWLSASGRLVAFSSRATNLPAGDGSIVQVYMHDRVTGKTRLVSKTSAGVAGDASSRVPSLSGNGRYVAFASSAGNLPGADSIDSGLYIHDRKRRKTRLGSKAADGTPVEAIDGQISGDGNHLVFQSNASELPQGDGDTYRVYVKDLRSGTVRLASATSAGLPANDNCGDEALSNDGSAAVFTCYADNMPGGDGVTRLVYIRDLVNGTTRLVSKSNSGDAAEEAAYDPFISGNGKIVNFYTFSNNLPGLDDVEDVYVYTVTKRRVALASRNSAGQAVEDDSEAYPPSLSRNGAYIVFRTNGDNLPGSGSGTQLYRRGPLR